MPWSSAGTTCSTPWSTWARCRRRTRPRDRKSTRLNSSHSQISYAVFCLKKKTDEVSVTPLVVDVGHGNRDRLSLICLVVIRRGGDVFVHALDYFTEQMATFHLILMYHSI